MASHNFSAGPEFEIYLDKLRGTFSEDKSSVIRRAIKALYEHPIVGNPGALDALSSIGLTNILFDHREHDFSAQLRASRNVMLSMEYLPEWLRIHGHERAIVDNIEAGGRLTLFLGSRPVSDLVADGLSATGIYINKSLESFFSKLRRLIKKGRVSIVLEPWDKEHWLVGLDDNYYTDIWIPNSFDTAFPFCLVFSMGDKDRNVARRIQNELHDKILYYARAGLAIENEETFDQITFI